MVGLITISFLYTLTAQIIQAAPCAPKVSPFADTKSLYHQVAIVGEDNRVERSPDAFGANVEAAQARLWCHKRGPKPKGKTLKRSQLSLENFRLSNATLAFDDDMAIVNRHTFLDENGKKKADFTDCFVEHISSGEIVRVEDGAYPPLGDVNDPTSVPFQDFAVIRLSKTPTGASAIKRDDIAISPRITPADQLKVVSNVAANNKNGNIEALTMAVCKSYGRYAMNGARVPVHGTDCDTGDGSSGAQIYADRGGPKFSGIVSSEIVKVPEGGDFDPKKLSTVVSEFDESLIEAYETLKARRDI